MGLKMGLKKAISEWRQVLDVNSVLTDKDSINRFCENTGEYQKYVSVVILPKTSSEISAIVRIAYTYKISLYVVSTGHNWGYGTASPVIDCSVVLTLSKLNSIVEFDKELGLVTLEPGVTQGMLFEYVKQHNVKYLVPTTGAGADASIVGNALERGYGLTPYMDHFDAVTWIEAVLPDGSMYKTPLTNLGGVSVDKAYKYSLGVYTDGLFSQGNFGIVTKMSIKLAPIPECVESFFIWIPHDFQLEKAVLLIREILSEYENIVGSINLLNQLRSFSMSFPYPFEMVNPETGILDSNTFEKYAKKRHIPAWMVTGALYGSHEVVRAVRVGIKKKIRKFGFRGMFFNERDSRMLKKFFSLPLLRDSKIHSGVQSISEAMNILQGKPSSLALKISYWVSGINFDKVDSPNPAHDHTGLLWYSPLVRMKPNEVREYVSFVRETCTKHGFDPLITLTSLSRMCFDSSIPILFNVHTQEKKNKAHQCYEDLLTTGIEYGFVPYRLSVEGLQILSQKYGTLWKFADTLKSAVDPRGIISPGRYTHIPKYKKCKIPPLLNEE